jgi:hypothetical protein
VPVALKLSRLFYDRLGEDVTNELVDLLNQIDATYRSELSMINELNWTRFEARLEQGLAELRAELTASQADLKAELIASQADLKTQMVTGDRSLRADLERGFKEQTRWMFFAWITLLIPIVGLWMRG